MSEHVRARASKTSERSLRSVKRFADADEGSESLSGRDRVGNRVWRMEGRRSWR